MNDRIRLFVCGDVMAGRGIDQILRHPSDPALYEPYVRSALDYVTLAERKSGPIPRAVDDEYIWGDALEEIAARRPDACIVNLETSITTSETPEPKGINYRMHPGNVGCVTAAGTDCCVLANNHVADWGPDSLSETIEALKRENVAVAGAGADAAIAASPAVLPVCGGGRIIVFGFGCPSSGVPESWAAGTDRPGVNFLGDLGEASRRFVADCVKAWKRPGDLVIASIHWGPNWGYGVPRAHQEFARYLVGEAGVDLVHGHSSHHPMAIEVNRGSPLLYGCGDFINDYEGIGGNESYRPELTLAFFVDIDQHTRRLDRLEMVPFELRKFRLNRASGDDREWLRQRMDRECGRFGHRVELTGEAALRLIW